MKYFLGIIIGLMLGGSAAYAVNVAPRGQGVLNQGIAAVAVTPNDSTVLIPTRALYIGDAAACNVAVILVNDTAAVTFPNVQVGQFLPLTATKVMSTNTTCTVIKALY